MVTFLRAAAGVALALAVIAGLLYLLVAANFTLRLEDSQVYKAAVSETGAYARIYDEVLVDEALRERSGRLLGNVEMADHGDAVRVLRDIMPPDYLREQTGDNIDRFTGYLRHESADLELYVSLTGPLERLEPAALGEAHRFIDELGVAEPESSGCSLAAVQRLAAASAEPLARLSEGELPATAPSLKILSRECREREFDRWFGLVVDDPLLDSPAARTLRGEREALRLSFVEGDTRGFLKAAAGPAVRPLTDGAVAGVRRNLQPGDRFDLLDWAADRSPDLDRRDIEAGAESLRANAGRGERAGPAGCPGNGNAGQSPCWRWSTCPRPAPMLGLAGRGAAAGRGASAWRWGFAAQSVLPGLVRRTLLDAVSYPADVPVSAIDLAGDLVESLLRQAAGGFVAGTAAVMVLGGGAGCRVPCCTAGFRNWWGGSRPRGGVPPEGSGRSGVWRSHGSGRPALVGKANKAAYSLHK